MPSECDICVRFGQRVRELREQSLALSQEKFADKANVHRTYVSHVERGIRNPSLRNVQKLAKGLEVTMSVLLEGLDS